MSPARAWACPTGRAGTDAARLYLHRPAGLSAGPEVAIRGVVREVVEGQYANVPGAVYRFEVADSRGRLIVARPVTLSDFGTFHESLRSTRPRRWARIGSGSSSRARATSPAVSGPVVPARADRPGFDLKKTVFYRGETVAGRSGRPLPVRSARREPADRGQPSRRPDPPRHDRRRRQVSLRVSHRGIRRGAGARAGRPAAAGQRGGRRRRSCSRSAASRST